jgi:NAD+ synthase
LVTGTTNKSEFVQGYFVKYGDGGVDIEPLANLYKTQVYQLAKYIDVPKEILNRKASPDTWSFEVSDEEFFYSIPYQIVDLAWHLKEKNISHEQIRKTLNLTQQQINRIISDQKRKWDASKHMREIPPSWNANIVSLNY